MATPNLMEELSLRLKESLTIAVQDAVDHVLGTSSSRPAKRRGNGSRKPSNAYKTTQAQKGRVPDWLKDAAKEQHQVNVKTKADLIKHFGPDLTFKKGDKLPKPKG